MKECGGRAKNTALAKSGGPTNQYLKGTSSMGKSMDSAVITGVTAPISKVTGRTTNKTDWDCSGGVMSALTLVNSRRGRCTAWDTTIRLTGPPTKVIST